jgi:hypothetical protein
MDGTDGIWDPSRGNMSGDRKRASRRRDARRDVGDGRETDGTDGMRDPSAGANMSGDRKRVETCVATWETARGRWVKFGWWRHCKTLCWLSSSFVFWRFVAGVLRHESGDLAKVSGFSPGGDAIS